MKTFFIIEADTEMHSLFAYAVERENDGVGDFYIYKRRMACDATVQEIDPPKFFGQLNALLPTRETINHAKPLTLVAEKVEATA